MLALLLTSCGGEGSIDLPSPTASPTGSVLPSRTGSLPAATRSPSRSSEPPSESASETSTPSDSPTESEQPTESERPTESASATESASPTESPRPTETASPSPAEETAETESATDEGIPAWVWWLLAGLAVAAVLLALILVPRARRRSAWDEELAAAESGAAWLARELLPQLQQVGSPAEVSGGWQVAAGRVTQVEDQLTGLESSAPDEVRRNRALLLRDALRDARHGVEQVIVTRDPTTVPRDLAAVATNLSAVLDRARPTG